MLLTVLLLLVSPTGDPRGCSAECSLMFEYVLSDVDESRDACAHTCVSHIKLESSSLTVVMRYTSITHDSIVTISNGKKASPDSDISGLGVCISPVFFFGSPTRLEVVRSIVIGARRFRVGASNDMMSAIPCPPFFHQQTKEHDPPFRLIIESDPSLASRSGSSFPTSSQPRLCIY